LLFFRKKNLKTFFPYNFDFSTMMTMSTMNKIYGGAYALPHLGIAGLHDPIMTLEADVSVKRRERAARLGKRKHAGRDFTAPEKFSFLSYLTDHCFRVCGVLEFDNPHHVGAVAFVFILGVFSYMNVRRYLRRRHIRWNASFELDRTKLTGKAAPRILRKDLIYSDITHIPIIESRLKNATDFEAFFGRVEALDGTVVDTLTYQLFSDCDSITLEPLVCSFHALRENQDVLPEDLLKMLIMPHLEEPDDGVVGEDVMSDESILDGSSAMALDSGLGVGFGIGSAPILVGEPGDQESSYEQELLGTNWVHHRDYSFVRRSARLAVSRTLR
jgi:hypothetical protein